MVCKCFSVSKGVVSGCKCEVSRVCGFGRTSGVVDIIQDDSGSRRPHKWLLDHDNGDDDDGDDDDDHDDDDDDDDDNHDKQLTSFSTCMRNYLGTFRLPRRKAALDAMKPKAHLVV